MNHTINVIRIRHGHPDDSILPAFQLQLWNEPARRVRLLRLLRTVMRNHGFITEAQWRWLHYIQFCTHSQLRD